MKTVTKLQQKSIENPVKEIKEDKELADYLDSIQLVYQKPPFKKHLTMFGSLEKLKEIIRNYEEKESIIKRKKRYLLLIDRRLWKELIKNRIRDYPLAFDHFSIEEFQGEKGYFNAMYKAFELMLKTLQQPLTIELIEAIHDMAVENVKTTENENMHSGYSENPKHNIFGLLLSRSPSEINQNLSLAGLDKLIEMGAFNNHPRCFFKLQYAISENCDIDLNTKDLKEIKENFANDETFECMFIRKGKLDQEKSLEQLQSLIDAYYKAIETSQHPDDKITAIANFCQQANWLHIFSDGNIRTFVFLIANKLLLENGFPPAIFDNPNQFDGYHVDELTQIIKNGINVAKILGFKSIKEETQDLKLNCK